MGHTLFSQKQGRCTSVMCKPQPETDKQHCLQFANGFMVAWNDGKRVVDEPDDKLNINPLKWLGITPAIGLCTAAWFVQSNTKAAATMMAGAQASHKSGLLVGIARTGF